MTVETGRRNPVALDLAQDQAESTGGVERFDPLSETDSGPLIGGRPSGKETRVHVCVNPKQFLPRLKALAPLVGRHYPSPILETVQMQATEDRRGVLRATNGDAGAEVEVPLLKVIRPGAVQLPTNSIIKAITDAKTWSVDIEELASDTLLFSLDPKVPSRKVAVRTPQCSVTLPTYDPEPFPAITPVELTQAVEIAAWRFRRLLARTHFAADEDSTRYALGGCAFEFSDGALHCIATDGRCLAHAFENATGTGLTPPPTTTVGGDERPLAPAVPIRALKALAGILDTTEYPALTLGFTPEGKFQVRARGLLFVARLLEGRFPPWKEVFPEPSKTALRVMDPGRFLQVLKETTRYTTRQSRATELRLHRHVLTIVVENDRARTTRELVVRNLSEASDNDYNKEASIVVDPRYVLEYLAAQTQPFVLSFPPEKGTPLLCESEGFRFALMPLERAGEVITADGRSGPQAADRPETTLTQQEPNHEVPRNDEALSA